MSMTDQLQQLLENSIENEVVEFKEAKNSYDLNKLGRYFSALSNEANLKGLSQAWLLFGVKDDRTVVGSQFRPEPKQLMSLKKEVADKTSNRLSFIEIHEVMHPQGRVLLFEIPAAPKGVPIAWDGHWYGRDGESLGPLNLEEIERIRQQERVYDWSAEICPSANIADLSPLAIEQAKLRYKAKHKHLADEIDTWCDETFLNKLKLSVHGVLTRAALLLLGRPESAHFIAPASARLSWILKDRDGIEEDYEHFDAPLILAVDKLFSRVRNLKYRYMTGSSLFPEEVEKYDSWVIREALHNCIAHQDYALGAKVVVVEFPDRLVFTNKGSFIPGNIDQVIKNDAPETYYRNNLLAQGMVGLNMIDTIGSGIRKMFMIQRKRFFPMPDYKINTQDVTVTVYGRIVDERFSRLLAENSELSLHDVIMLDKVQKHTVINDDELKYLRDKKLIEGRKPNIYVSVKVAQAAGDKVNYTRQRAFDKQYYLDLILSFIQQHGETSRADIDQLLWDKLPEYLNDKQRKTKVNNLLNELANKQGKIQRLSKSTRYAKWGLIK